MAPCFQTVKVTSRQAEAPKGLTYLQEKAGCVTFSIEYWIGDIAWCSLQIRKEPRGMEF